MFMTRCALAVAFWIAAAIVIVAVHREACTLIAVVAAAYLYTRLCSAEGGVSHALGVGIAWLTLTVVTELIVARVSGHGWYTLLGRPDHPLMRNVTLFAWIFAPAVFARGA